MRNWLLVCLCILVTNAGVRAQAFLLENQYLAELHQLHFGAAIRASGHPWAEHLWDHRFHVVMHDNQEWAVFVDQTAPRTDFRMWSLARRVDGVWKMMPDSVMGVALTDRAVAANRDRMVHRLHLEKIPARIIDAMFSVDDFLAFPADPEASPTP